MSEEKKNTSGIKPEVLRPTVIGDDLLPEAKITPTVIKSSPSVDAPVLKNGGKKPTVIDLSSENSTTVTPRIVTTPVVVKPTEIKTGPLPPPIVKQASMIPGVERKPLSIDCSMLARRFPGTPEKTLEETQRIVSRVFLDTLNESECAQWGFEHQRRYGVIADESLKFATSKKVQDNGRHLSRLLQLLQELAASFDEKETFWRKPKTPWERLREMQVEIDQLRHELNTSLPDILELKGKLEALSSDSDKLIIALNAYSLSAIYLADLVKDQRAQSLNDRSTNLLRTVASIQEGIILRQATIIEIGMLAEKIQDAVLITLPAWLECASALAGKSLCTETEMYKAREGLCGIVDRLK